MQPRQTSSREGLTLYLRPEGHHREDCGLTKSGTAATPITSCDVYLPRCYSVSGIQQFKSLMKSEPIEAAVKRRVEVRGSPVFTSRSRDETNHGLCLRSPRPFFANWQQANGHIGRWSRPSLLCEPNKYDDPPQRDIHLGYHRNKTYYKGISFPKAPVHSIGSRAAWYCQAQHDSVGDSFHQWLCAVSLCVSTK